MRSPQKWQGYLEAVQQGLSVSAQPMEQAVLVSNGCGDLVCLLCTDKVETMVTVSATALTGDAAFAASVVLPGT